MAIREGVLVALRLDVHTHRRLLELLHLNFVVEVANVADDGVVLHLAHVIARDDVLVTGGCDENIGSGDDILHGDHLIALHAGLQRADRVDLGDVHNSGLRLHGLSRALADVTKPTDHNLLAREHDIGGAHDAVRQRVAAAIHVIELGLSDAVVHVDRREQKLTLVRHRYEAVDTGGSLLRDTDHARNHLGEALRVLRDRALDGGKNALELGVGRGGRVGQRAILGKGVLELLALVEQQGRISSIINNLVAALAIRPREGLVRAPPVLLKRLTLPSKDVGSASTHAGRSGMVLRGEDVARAPADVGAKLRKGLNEHAGLNGHVQRAHDTNTCKRLRRAELRARSHQARHLVLCNIKLLPAKVRERHVSNLVVASSLNILGRHGCSVLMVKK
mmetsp:Transcript_30048/g.64586  ORF Transcript_30048/g.64586 Transcript_30048/m.64586 type:complete len:391 (-) Transcript_30048:30-1202(-)